VSAPRARTPAHAPHDAAPTGRLADLVPRSKGDHYPLALSLSAVVLLAVLVYFLIRFTALELWKAVACILLGFFLASSSLAPYITAACRAAARFLAGLDI
jgi:hypothetical protein